MKQFIYFALEGLMRQGAHEVWVTLATYDSAEKASQANPREASAVRPGIVATRVMPCYRVAAGDGADSVSLA